MEVTMTNTTKVVNIKDSRIKYDVYIGRAGNGQNGYFGNPCKVGRICTVCGLTHYHRGETITCFEIYARRRMIKDDQYKEAIKALYGKVLGCFCAPDSCHGDVLVKLCEELNLGPPSHDAA